jgi:Amt family ammonium transporter
LVEQTITNGVLATALAFLLPVGLALLYTAALSERWAVQAATTALAVIALAFAGYLAVGFAFQFGGVALVSDRPGLSDLYWEWSALDRDWGPGWGMIGLKGFFLAGPLATTASYALFLSQLPLLASATLILALALRGRAAPLAVVAGTLLVATVVYPVAGNWVWGGGWLYHLGQNLQLGHGFVDFLGAGTVHLAGAAVTMAGLIAFKLKHRSPGRPQPEEVNMPPAYLPVLAILGALLSALGGMGLVLSNPLFQGLNLSPAVAAVNLLLAMAGGALAASLYTWFTTGYLDPLMSARGMVAGLISASAVAPFAQSWAALVVGVVAGLFLPSAIYLVGYLLRLDDPTAIVAGHGISGLWGLLAVGLFADGQYGLGWNGVGAVDYLGITGQGVSGYLTVSGFSPDWPGQLFAQIVGAAAIFLFAFGCGWLVFRIIAQVIAVWEKTGLEFGPIPAPATSSPVTAEEGTEPAAGDPETAAR